MVYEYSGIINLEHIDAMAQQLYELRPEIAVYTLTGPLGAGKTTLTKALLKKFGVHEAVTSPTFTYVNVYKLPNKQTIYHFDLYRVQTLDQFIITGFDEYLYQQNSWTFVEWPAVIAPLLTHNVCNIELDYHSEHERTMRRINSRL